jgi:hypothetical protein
MVTINDTKTIQHIINHATNPLDLERVKDEIRQVYGKINKGKPQKQHWLLAKKFKKACRICVTKGHKAADFWEKENNKDKPPTRGKLQRKKVKQQILLAQDQNLVYLT